MPTKLTETVAFIAELSTRQAEGRQLHITHTVSIDGETTSWTHPQTFWLLCNECRVLDEAKQLQPLIDAAKPLTD